MTSDYQIGLFILGNYRMLKIHNIQVLLIPLVVQLGLVVSYIFILHPKIIN